MTASGFTNSWTSGEISDDAWDRVELQPVAKGCEQALNLVIRIAGPLGKRRGFWFNGAVADPTKRVRMVPFRKSLTSAFALELGDGVAFVWNIDGTKLLDGGGAQVTFATPWSEAQLDGLRYKQVVDVVYFTHRDGLPPQQLVHTNDLTWTFSLTGFVNGPWLAENTDLTKTITVTGTSLNDVNTASGAGVMQPGTVVALVASSPVFRSAQVGSNLRLRQGTSGSGVLSWTAKTDFAAFCFLIFNGNIYEFATEGAAGTRTTGNTPPVHTSGTVSDGNHDLKWLHDGSGVVRIDAVADSTHATGTVIKSVPLKSAVATSYYSFAAYSEDQGWPTMWPELREERLCYGGPAQTHDWFDLTQTAGFNPSSLDFTPGLGTGAIVDTNSIRRRAGIDGSKLIWASTATYLLLGSETGEYLVAGSVLDEPLSPAAVTEKQLSKFGSADVYPAQAHKGLLYVTRAGQTLRGIDIDTQQGAGGVDHSYLAGHIGKLGLRQLAWLPDPDNQLWIRLGDGNLACFTYHQEQGVAGFTRQQLGGGFVCEDEIVLPGPGGRETVWLVVSRTVDAVVQRQIWMQSQPADRLFMDAAQAYAGAPVSTLAGLDYGAGGPIQAVCEGAWIDDPTVAEDGTIAVPAGTTAAQVGYTYPVYFKSLKLDLRIYNGALLQRQRIASAIVDLFAAQATIGSDNGQEVSIITRNAGDVATFSGHRIAREVDVRADNDAEGVARDPRIVIQEQTPFDFVLYALKPNQVQAGA